MRDRPELRAYCPGCHRNDVRTVNRNGRKEYVMHGFVPGGVSCLNSGQPVDPPQVQR